MIKLIYGLDGKEFEREYKTRRAAIVHIHKIESESNDIGYGPSVPVSVDYAFIVYEDGSKEYLR